MTELSRLPEEEGPWAEQTEPEQVTLSYRVWEEPTLGELAVRGSLTDNPIDQVLQMPTRLDGLVCLRLESPAETIELFYRGEELVYARGGAGLPRKLSARPILNSVRRVVRWRGGTFIILTRPICARDPAQCALPLQRVLLAAFASAGA